MTFAKIDWLCVTPETSLVEVLKRHAGAADRGHPAGIALVTDASGSTIGTITDGDVRRAILREGTLDIKAEAAMSKNPILFPDTWSFSKILSAIPAELEKRQRRSLRILERIVLVDHERRPTRVLDYHQLWEQRVATHRHVVVLGMGYVGLTLALVLAEEGFHVTGVDIDGDKLSALQRGESHVHELGLAQLLREQLGGNFVVASELPDDGDVYVIAVGTPVSAGNRPRPQLTALRHATEMVGQRLRRGGLVILRSTVPVGTTRQVVLPLLEETSRLRGGIDFHIAFAPERTAEGKALEELRMLPQVIGGLNEDSTSATVALFRELAPTIVRVGSLEAAELVKLVNNSYRDVVFAFSNEITQIAAPFNLDVVEVIRAANHGYPRDIVPLPSPGVGGPCLTKDPYILSAVAEKGGYTSTLAEHGRRVNESMHSFVVEAVLSELKALGKQLDQCRIAVCGLAFKGRPETGDIRNSSGLEIAKRLQEHVEIVYGHDPVATPDIISGAGLTPTRLPEGFAGMDAVLILNNHPYYEKTDVFALVRALRGSGILYDAWHLFRPEEVLRAAPCVYMGLGFTRSSVMS